MLALLLGFHAIYISVVEVSYLQESEEVAITIKVFTDDLEDAIRNHSSRISLSNCVEGREAIVNYLRKTFALSTSSKNIALSWVTCENTEDSIWIILKGTASEFVEVGVRANYFFELFPTQTHVISIRSDDQKQFIKLTKTKQEGSVTFR